MEDSFQWVSTVQGRSRDPETSSLLPVSLLVSGPTGTDWDRGCYEEVTWDSPALCDFVSDLVQGPD